MTDRPDPLLLRFEGGSAPRMMLANALLRAAAAVAGRHALRVNLPAGEARRLVAQAISETKAPQ